MKNKIKLLGFDFSAMGLNQTAEWILKNKGTVYCCTLNEVLAAEEDKNFRNVLNDGDLLTTDGMPLVWLMKLKTGKGERVYGPDILERFQKLDTKEKGKQFFIGDAKNEKYFRNFGDYLVLPYKDSFNDGDYKRIVGNIVKSRARVIWVGLGSKKQIIVASELKKRLPDRVYVTVGAAFDFLSGNKKQAPKWIRNIGGEWLYRLLMEPKRLTRRYLMVMGFLLKVLIGRIVREKGSGRCRRGKD